MLLSEKEIKSIENFRERHYKKKCHIKSHKSAKFKITLEATGGLGDSIKIKCCNCKESKNITDIGNW